MSFLNSVLTSIGTGEPSSITPPPAIPKASSHSTSTLTNKVSTTQGNGSGLAQRPRAEQHTFRPANNITKVMKPSASIRSRPSTPQALARPISSTKTSGSGVSKLSLSTQKACAPISSKPPPKGSYADMMAQAKALQQQKPSNVGLIKHQTVTKERMSKVKRERLLKEAKQRELVTSKGKKPPVSPGATSRVRDGILQARKSSSEPGYKGTARPSNTPTYNGTSGLPSRRDTGAAQPKSSRAKQPRARIRDEYLGTDEEDEGDYYGADDYYDDYSDASSDMEAGVMDMEMEEQQALRLAKHEDERELRAEMEAKKAKLERKRKLTALSKSRR